MLTKPGRTKSSTSARTCCGVADVETLGRTEEIGERDARDPLAEARGVGVVEEARERGRDERSRGAQHRVLALEREERKEELGLVRADERERPVTCEARRPRW